MIMYDEIECMWIYWIYWDICFLKDKMFYKVYFSGGFVWVFKWCWGGYYFYIELGVFFVGGGFWGFVLVDLKCIWVELVVDVGLLWVILVDLIFVEIFGSL